MENKKLLVRIDLYGEGELYDVFEGYIYGLTFNEFMEIRKDYEHDGSDDIRTTWANFLEEKDVEFKYLEFDLDEY